ncbi:MAG: hypothetical protein Ta2A_14690 [Treponemataceae bacterium]|nr:MAG: hypothetical protein Ta2A_14690 [Treponemataceae bacterium]
MNKNKKSVLIAAAALLLAFAFASCSVVSDALNDDDGESSSSSSSSIAKSISVTDSDSSSEILAVSVFSSLSKPDTYAAKTTGSSGPLSTRNGNEWKGSGSFYVSVFVKSKGWYTYSANGVKPAKVKFISTESRLTLSFTKFIPENF